MDTKHFERFAPVISSLSAAELNGADSLFAKLLLASHGDISVCYAPFEYINPQARLVLVGITPGKTQMLNALREARRQLDLGRSTEDVLRSAKKVGGFSGDLRGYLVKLLDHVGVQHWLSIPTCADLFEQAGSLLQTASMLRNPVFFRGKDYNGTPKMTRTPLLNEQLFSGFVKDIQTLPSAVIIPLGKPVVDTLELLANQGLVDRQRVLFGLPHPSPQNIERIRYFCGEKPRAALSVKTNPDTLDFAKAQIIRQIKTLT